MFRRALYIALLINILAVIRNEDDTKDAMDSKGLLDDTKDAMDSKDLLGTFIMYCSGDWYGFGVCRFSSDFEVTEDWYSIGLWRFSSDFEVCRNIIGPRRRSGIYSDIYWMSALEIEGNYIKIHRIPFGRNYRSSSALDDTKNRNSCAITMLTIDILVLTAIWEITVAILLLTGIRVITLAIPFLPAITMLTIDFLSLTAIGGITVAIMLLAAITMLTIDILVLTGLQSISGSCKTRDTGNCQELITIRRKVKEFIKIIKLYPFIEWEICLQRCGNSSSAAEKQVVRALSTAFISQMFKRASKKHLGLKFLGAYSGSIIIRFVTEMGKSLQKVKDACVSGKIKEFLPNIFVGTGVESKLGEGDVMWKYYVYKGPLSSSGRNVDTARAAATEIQEEILNPIKLHWNLFVEELDPRKLYADLKSEGLLGDQDGNEMLKIVSRKDRMIFLLEKLDALKEPGLGYELLLDHCREHDEYVLQKIMEKEQLQASSKPQEQSTSTGWMSDQKLIFSATIILSVHKKASTVGMKNTGPKCDKEFEITCLDVLDPVCYFDNMVEEGDDDLQEVFMKLEQVREPEEEKIAIKTKQPCLKTKKNIQIDA